MQKINYISRNENWIACEEIHPKPITEYVPKWFQDIPNANQYDYRTVKTCPAFIDIYSEGFVVLAPQDYEFTYDKENETFNWKTGQRLLEGRNDEVDDHLNEQFLHLYKDHDYKIIFKLNMPYYIITPPGYSIRQYGIPYSSNENWDTTHGTFKADVVHEMNIHVMIKTLKDFKIKQGEPLAVQVPFKREDYTTEVSHIDEAPKDIKKRFLSSELLLHGKMEKRYWRNKFHKK